MRGRGGRIGPDLSNLIHRDYESVLRDIRLPSATIHPDYLTYLVELKDGRVLTGVPRTEGDELVIGDDHGKEVRARRSDVEALHPSALSIMPEGLEKAVGPERMRDLLTFLLTEPLQPAPLERDGAPPPRKRAEVDAVLKGSARRPPTPASCASSCRPGRRTTARENTTIPCGRNAGRRSWRWPTA